MNQVSAIALPDQQLFARSELLHQVLENASNDILIFGKLFHILQANNPID